MKKSSVYFFLMLICFSVSGIVYPQQYQHTFKRFADDGISVLKAPLDWQKKDFLRFGLLSAATYSLMHIDEDIRSFSIENSHYSDSFAATAMKYWGEPVTSGVLSAILIIQGFAADNIENRELGFLVAESYLFTGGVTGAIKYSFGRERPRLDGSAFSFHPFAFRNDDFLSFPSGHTSTSFALSTVLASRMNTGFLKALIYVPAFAAGLSRIYQNQHWLSDVFFGAFLGYYIGSRLVDRNRKSGEQTMQPSTPPINIVNFKLEF